MIDTSNDHKISIMDLSKLFSDKGQEDNLKSFEDMMEELKVSKDQQITKSEFIELI